MLVFPSALFGLAAKDVDFNLPRLSGGEALNGVEDVIHPSGGAVWFAELPDVALVSRSRTMAWRAFKAATNGGADAFVFPICDARHQPVGVSVGVPFSDGSTFSDDTLFAGTGTSVVLAADAALRATEITITIDYLARPLIGGERFSIDHPTWRHRCYQVGSIASQTDEAATLQFHPPLREAVPAGAAVDFGSPRFVARIEAMAAPQSNPFSARGSARFLEDMTGAY